MTETHADKMARKAALRAQMHEQMKTRRRVAHLLGTPANINRRTGKPHEHKRERERNAARQQREV